MTSYTRYCDFSRKTGNRLLFDISLNSNDTIFLKLLKHFFLIIHIFIGLQFVTYDVSGTTWEWGCGGSNLLLILGVKFGVKLINSRPSPWPRSQEGVLSMFLIKLRAHMRPLLPLQGFNWKQSSPPPTGIH